jgi:predicted nucleic acid-binding protein
VILVDTSVWIDHLRSGDQQLDAFHNQGSVLTHPFVIGEVALGHLRQRDTIIAALHGLSKAIEAQENEVLQLIRKHTLFGLGIGYVDAHLIASTMLTNASLWTRDKRLKEVAARLSLATPIL